MTVTSDTLLSAPLTPGARAEVRYPRSGSDSLGYKNTSQQFKLGKKDYNRQYFEVYGARLKEMKPLVVAAARAEFGDKVSVKSLSELREDDQGERQDDILIVGTMFKQQELKPSILKELSEDGGLELEPTNTKYTSDNDTLVLEDETMRVKLDTGEGDVLTPDHIVNGVVAGVWGKEAQGGKFSVKKVFYPRLGRMESTGPFLEDKDMFLALMSGLEVGGEGSSWVGAAQLAVDWLVGSVGAPGEQEDVAKVERLVLAGDCLSSGTRDKEEQGKAKYLTANAAAGSLAAVRQLDDLLVQLCTSISTDLMPGPNDPATSVLPQQPLHKVMFPQAGLYPTLQSVSNPYSLEIGGRNIMVTSGQTITDILRNSNLSGPLEAMEKCLVWGHLAPTTPDTLGLYPYSDQDPHIMTGMPDVFVCGNQSSYGTKQVKIGEHEVLLVALPKFSVSSSLIRLNLRNLETDKISFHPDLDEEDNQS